MRNPILILRPPASLLIAFALLASVPDGASAQAVTPAPTLIPLSGELRTPEGQPRTGSVLLVISLYESREDPAPRWVEYQNVALDAAGRYTVQFGAAREDGLPADLFTSGPGMRWLGVAVENEAEQPRVPLLSVPYAAKAASADALAGRTVNDFVLTSNLEQDVRALLDGEDVVTPSAIVGTLNYVQKGDGAGGTKDSAIYESGGNVGIGTTSPTAMLDVSGNTLSPDGVLTLEAGGRLTAQAGNDLHVVAPNTRSIFFRIASPDAPRVEIDNIGRLGLGLGGAPPSALLDISGTTVSFDGILSLEPGGRLTTRDGNDLNIDTPASRALYLKNGGSTRMTVTGAGNVGIGTVNPSARLHVAGDVVVDGNIGAKYQDVAEWVDSTEPLEPGTVVVIDRTATNRVTPARAAYDVRVAGAISPQPGIVLGEAAPGRVLVAQSGRVRVKADARFGAIRPGDLLVSSGTKGHVMRSRPVKMGDSYVHRPGTVVGKALEALQSGQGEILVLLTLQ